MATLFILYRLDMYFSKLRIVNEIASRPYEEEIKLFLFIQ